MSKHAGEYDRHWDIEQAVNEAVAHEDWCHWNCPGHRYCGCGADMTDEAMQHVARLEAKP